MPLITAGSAGSSVLLPLAKKLPVHRDEQLLAVLPKSRVAPNGLDDIKGGLVIATGDRHVAEQARQGTGRQLQGSLQIWDLGRNRQRPAVLPLRYRRLAHANTTAERGQRQSALRPSLRKNLAELLPAHSSRHGGNSSPPGMDVVSIPTHPAQRHGYLSIVLSAIRFVLNALRWLYLLHSVRGLTMADPEVSSSRTAGPRDAMPRYRTTRGRAPRLHHEDRGASTADSLAAVARELAIQSRRDQGLPDHVTDPHALAQGVQLVLDARRRSTPRTARLP
jgi:hypothetical protein